MMINLSEMGVKHKRIVMATVLGFVLSGLLSYFTLPAQEDPTVVSREAVISTSFPGMSAQTIELLVTKTIEEGVRKVAEVKKIKSTSVQGTSTVYVQIDDSYSNLDQIWDQVRNELDRVVKQLPEGTPPPFLNDNYGDLAIFTVAIQAESGFSMGELLNIAQHARDELYLVKGIQSVDMLGAQQENIVIELSQLKSAQFGLSLSSIIAILKAENMLQSSAIIDINGSSFNVAPSAYFNSIEAIKNVVLPLQDSSQTIHLRDIAKVYRDVADPPQQSAYFNGKPAIVLAIVKNDQYSVSAVTPQIESRIAQLKQIMPLGVTMQTITKQADQAENVINSLSIKLVLLLSIVLALGILFLGLRAGLIVATLVTAVVLIVFVIQNFNGMALERMSMATLIISLGLLVDNAIVVTENFKKRIEDNEQPLDIVRNIGRNLAIPLLTSSATTMLVFLPLLLAQSLAGEYTRSVSIVLIYALVISWLLSLIVTPYLCYLFMKDGNKAKEKTGMNKVTLIFEKLNNAYLIFLDAILHQRLSFMLITVLLFVMAGASMSFVPVKLAPESDRAQVVAYIDLPAGSTMHETEKNLQQIFALLENKDKYEHVVNYAAYGGFGGPRLVLSHTPIAAQPNKAFLMLNLSDQQYQAEIIDLLREDFAQQIPNMQVRVGKMLIGPFSSDSHKLDIQVIGPDRDVVYSASQQVREILGSLKGTIEIRDDWGNKTTQVKVNIDQARAKRAGVNSADIALSLQTFYSGVTISQFREGDDLIPIVVSGDKQDRLDFSRLYSINVYSQSQNVNVPLEQIADIEFLPQFSRIAREDLFKTVTIEGKNLFLTAQDMAQILKPKLDALAASLPYSHRIAFDGVIKESKESLHSLIANIPLCLTIVALILLAQFNSFRCVGIIMLTVPLILIGAVAGLLVSGANFGFMVILGLSALAGIIVNHAILLIDLIEIERSDVNNKDDFAAVIRACKNRVRPILMTTTIIILALLPLIISHDPLFYGMASSLAFGLGFGTLLTLGVIPVLYCSLFKITPKQKSTC